MFTFTSETPQEMPTWFFFCVTRCSRLLLSNPADATQFKKKKRVGGGEASLERAI